MMDSSAQTRKDDNSSSRSGGDSEEDTPVPIPNTEVKLFSADGSWGVTPCESRTLPGEEKSSETTALFVFSKEILRLEN
jgi:hypothetical protein